MKCSVFLAGFGEELVLFAELLDELLRHVSHVHLAEGGRGEAAYLLVAFGAKPPHELLESSDKLARALDPELLVHHGGLPFRLGPGLLD